MATNPLIEEAQRQARSNSFGDAAAATSNQNVTQLPSAQPRSQQLVSRMLMGPPSTQQEVGQQQQLWRQAQSAAANERYDSAGAQMAQEARDAAFQRTQRSITRPLSGPVPAQSRGESMLAAHDAANPAMTPPPSAPAATPAPAPGYDRYNQGQTMGPPDLSRLASPGPVPAAAPTQPSNQVLPGVYQHGRGQYSDQAGGMGLPGNFTGRPNERNMAAADNLAGQQGLASYAGQPSPAAPASSNSVPLIEAAGIAPGYSGVIGSNSLMGSRTPEQQRRDAEVSASSIMNDGGRWDLHKGVSPARQALQAMDAQALEGIRGQNSLVQAMLRENAGLQREGMQQQGANQRSLISAMLDQQRINQAGEQLGYTNRTNKLVEAARNQVAAEPDPTKRRSLVQYMHDIEGKTTQADPYLVVPGGQQVDQASGRAYNTPSTVFNRSTGQFVQQPGQGSPLPPGMTRQVGTSGGKPVYEDDKGNRFVAG